MGMLKAARQEGHRVPANVLSVKAPSRVKSDREALGYADAVAILTLVLARPDGARWVAALLQGLRQGEALGLTWDAVNFTDRELDVSWQLQSLPYLDTKNKAAGFRVPDGYEARHLTHAYHLVRPKTTSGQRVVPLAPWMGESLQQWRQVAPENPWGLVWCGVDTRNGRVRPTPMRGVTDRRIWEGLQDAADVRHPSGRHYTMHEARNTAATMLFEAEVDPKTITQILGHSSIIVSRGYQTVSRAEARKALEKVAARLQLGMGG
jgi:integrase